MKSIVTSSSVRRSLSKSVSHVPTQLLALRRNLFLKFKNSGACLDCKVLQDFCPRCERWRTTLLRDVEKYPDVLRGVSSVSVMAKFGAIIRTGSTTDPKDAPVIYGASFQVDQLSRFLSHSWHASQIDKVLCIYSYFNGTIALIAGWSAVLVYVILLACGFAPKNLPWTTTRCVWVTEFVGRYDTEENAHLKEPEVDDHRPMLMFVYCGGYYFFMIFGQLIRRVVTSEPIHRRIRCLKRQRSAVFLDKMCIHQTDMVKKQRGINAIGAYLIQSAGVTILWDPTYFTRLWCVFEVAVFRRLNPDGVLEFRPLVFGRIVSIFHLFSSFIYCMSWADINQSEPRWGNVTILGYDNTTVLVTGAILPWVMCIVVYKGYCEHFQNLEIMKKTLKNFSAAKANCFAESDRVFVNNTICCLYGSLKEFDHHVRTQLMQAIQRESTNLKPHVIAVFSLLSPLLLQYCLNQAAFIATIQGGIPWWAYPTFALSGVVRAVLLGLMMFLMPIIIAYKFHHFNCWCCAGSCSWCGGSLLFMAAFEYPLEILFMFTGVNFAAHQDTLFFCMKKREPAAHRGQWFIHPIDSYVQIVPILVLMYGMKLVLSARKSDFEDEGSALGKVETDEQEREGKQADHSP